MNKIVLCDIIKPRTKFRHGGFVVHIFEVRLQISSLFSDL